MLRSRSTWTRDEFALVKPTNKAGAANIFSSLIAIGFCEEIEGKYMPVGETEVCPACHSKRLFMAKK